MKRRFKAGDLAAVIGCSGDDYNIGCSVIVEEWIEGGALSKQIYGAPNDLFRVRNPDASAWLVIGPGLRMVDLATGCYEMGIGFKREDQLLPLMGNAAAFRKEMTDDRS